MLLDREYKVPSKTNSKINLKVVPGHFATTSSHINFYMDMTTLKVRQKEAYEVAREMAKEYQYSKPIDTIVCMDGCEIIGACLAEELNKNGIMSLNQHDSLYVITPEFDGNGQMIFRDNLQPMVRGKNILLLLACNNRTYHCQKPGVYSVLRRYHSRHFSNFQRSKRNLR